MTSTIEVCGASEEDNLAVKSAAPPLSAGSYCSPTVFY